ADLDDGRRGAEEAGGFAEALGQPNVRRALAAAHQVAGFVESRRGQIKGRRLLELLGEIARTLRVVLIDEGDAHGRRGPAAAEHRAEEEAGDEREAEKPEEPHLVAEEEPEVFQSEEEEGPHQSRKLLPVRLRKTVSRLGRSTRNSSKRSPRWTSRANSSK